MWASIVTRVGAFVTSPLKIETVLLSMQYTHIYKYVEIIFRASAGKPKISHHVLRCCDCYVKQQTNSS